jgi:hypothetical protein
MENFLWKWMAEYLTFHPTIGNHKNGTLNEEYFM